MKTTWLLLTLFFPFVSIAVPQAWTLSNGEISRTIIFSERDGLVTQQISDLKTHTDFILQGKPRWNLPQEFSFQCNGTTYNGAGTQFGLVGAEISSMRNMKTLTVRLRSKTVPLEVTVLYSVYD